MKRFVLLALMVLALPTRAAMAQSEPSTLPPQETPPSLAKAATLSAKEKADVARIETYLNALKSFGASFLQVSDSGGLRHGALSLQRPGKMRVVYDEPDGDFLVADGSRLHMWDHEMQQQTTVGLEESLAIFLLRETLSLSGDVVLTHFVRYPAKIELTLTSTKTPEEGELTLVFEDNPLQLRQWRVLDAQGRTTGVNLENIREGIDFPENTFVFVSPKLGKTNRGSRFP